MRLVFGNLVFDFLHNNTQPRTTRSLSMTFIIFASITALSVANFRNATHGRDLGTSPTCPVGWHDQTDGNAMYWSCGCDSLAQPNGARGNCKGGCYVTDDCACACTKTATCDDGIMNQDELEIDCGGDTCKKCEGGWQEAIKKHCHLLLEKCVHLEGRDMRRCAQGLKKDGMARNALKKCVKKGWIEALPWKISPTTDRKVFSVSDPRILYVGRFDANKTEERIFSWPGTQLSFRIKGTGATLLLDPGTTANDTFQVLVDGKPYGEKIQCSQAEVPNNERKTFPYTLVADLPHGKHTIGIWKLTEAGMPSLKEGHGGWKAGASILKGITLPEGTKLLNAPGRPLRHLRYIGDSDTAGFCADGIRGVDDGVWAPGSANNYVGWSAVIARSFQATYTAQAVSGIGLVEHLPEENAKSILGGFWVIFQSIMRWMGNTNAFDDEHDWNVNSPEDTFPDAVVSMIGPNDFTELNHNYHDELKAGNHTFELNAVHTFFEKLATTYSPDGKPQPRIILVCGGSGNGFDACEALKEAIATWNERAQDLTHPVSYVSMHRSTWTYINKGPQKDSFLGCAEHYNAEGHAVAASELQPQIGNILGWGHVSDYNWCAAHSECSTWCADPENNC